MASNTFIKDKSIPEKMEERKISLDEYPAHLRPLVLYNKNRAAIRCKKCDCLILSPGTAEIVQKEHLLPAMHKKSDAGNFPEENCPDFWFVDNMFVFENVGFSNTVGTLKYLVCADCEEGPIGFHDTQSKKAFYVAVCRVKQNAVIDQTGT